MACPNHFDRILIGTRAGNSYDCRDAFLDVLLPCAKLGISLIASPCPASMLPTLPDLVVGAERAKSAMEGFADLTMRLALETTIEWRRHRRSSRAVPSAFEPVDNPRHHRRRFWPYAQHGAGRPTDLLKTAF